MQQLLVRVGVALTMAATVAASGAAELLNARVTVETGEAMSFHLNGENRDDVVGGSIELGARSFTIARVSRSGLIGASRPNSDGADAEFAVFSSSFSHHTAVGQPWVLARRYSGCDAPYNSFLAIYRVEGADAVNGLGPTPYARLTDDMTASQSSHVYCFVSSPPADG